MRSLLAAVFVFCAIAAPVAACGDSDDGESNSNGVESLPPAEVVNRAAEALRGVRSFHLEGTVTLDGRSTAIRVDLEQPNKVSLSFRQRRVEVALIGVGGSLYAKANEAFLEKQAGRRAAALLAGRWFEASESSADLREIVDEMDPKTLSRCLKLTHGKLESGGAAEVDGRPAVVIVDKGDRPGSAPGKLFVASSGPPLPLRVEATGDERPGARRNDECNDPGSSTRAGDTLTFSRYDETLNIAPPPNVLDADQAAGRPTA